MYDQFSHRETSMYNKDDCCNIIKKYNSSELHHMQQGKHGNVSNNRDVYIEKIDLGEGISMSLKYPTYDEIGSINNENAAEGTMQLIRICADKIYSGVDTVDDLKDYSEQEIGNFLDSLKGEALKGIQLFFEDMPKLSHTIDYEIKGKKKQHTFEGIADFFTYA